MNGVPERPIEEVVPCSLLRAFHAATYPTDQP